MENKVMGPAIGLIVLGILGALSQVASLLVGSFAELVLEWSPTDQREDVEQFLAFFSGGGVVLYVVGLAVDVFIAWAGFQMLRLKSWTAAVVANVMMMIPCITSCCCVIGVPLGIWGLIVLFDKNVKSAFEAKDAS